MLRKMTIDVNQIHNGFMMRANFLGLHYCTPATFYPDGESLSKAVSYMCEHSKDLISAVYKEHDRLTAPKQKDKTS
jgi:hypothetical protein